MQAAQEAAKSANAMAMAEDAAKEAQTGFVKVGTAQTAGWLACFAAAVSLTTALVGWRRGSQRQKHGRNRP